ncbi:rubredoxin [Rhodospirillum rubrum]|uniref:rubredoxin n=1 Tax=Rhodospirillum rubrum TaxID=1085 RepID=UPI0019037084|nr:rubredoxin [Rhodospirillum rubrum]MBK1664448.1 rubredoxin [Rhodospirillum rubrum]MBK1676154.1 rubredoxin [Rhodospirillum rubrum]
MTGPSAPLTRRRILHLARVLGLGGLIAPAIGTARAAPPSPGKWVCTNADCDPYIYDPALGDPVNLADPHHPLPPGLAFEDLPAGWLCPNCGSPKSFFRPSKR